MNRPLMKLQIFECLNGFIVKDLTENYNLVTDPSNEYIAGTTKEVGELIMDLYDKKVTKEDANV